MKLIESTVYRETLERGAALERVKITRAHLYFVLDAHFPGQIPQDALDRIGRQDNYLILSHWFLDAVYAKDAAAFLAKMV